MGTDSRKLSRTDAAILGEIYCSHSPSHQFLVAEIADVTELPPSSVEEDVQSLGREYKEVSGNYEFS